MTVTADQLSNILWDGTLFILACMGMCAGIAAGLPAPVDPTKVDLSKASFLKKLTGTRVYYYWWRMINAIGGNWGQARNFADPKQLAILNIIIKTVATALVSMKGASLLDGGDEHASTDTTTHTDTPTPEITHIDPTTKLPVISTPTTPPVTNQETH